MVSDFHTHILPHVDDGSASSAQTAQMLDACAGQEIPRVVLTPHFYANHDTPQRFLQRRDAAVEKLQQQLQPHWPSLYVGAEVHYFEGISDCDALEALCVDQTRCLLVEMPSGVWSQRMFSELESIRRKRGLTPIIAHIDRYITPFNRKRLLSKLEKLPVLIQANAEFFTCRATRRTALDMLRQGHIHLLGSDCHNMSQRSPNLGQAAALIRQKLGPDSLQHVEAWEQRVFSGEKPDQKLLTLRRI